MKHPTLLTIISLFGITFITTGSHAETKLSWKLKEGETIHYLATKSTHYILKKSTQVKTTIDRRKKASLYEHIIEKNFKTEMTWKVNKVNKDGSFDITHTVNRIQYTVDSRLQENTENLRSNHFKWDSASKKKQKGVLAKAVENCLIPMIGVKTSITLAPDGTLRAIKIPKKITKMLAEGLVFTGAESVLSSDAIKEMFGAAGGVFPKNPVKVGDSWKDAKKEEKITKDTFTYTYQYKGKNKNGLEEIASYVELKKAPKTKSVRRSKIKVKESQGKMLFDNKAGRIQSNRTKLAYNIDETSKDVLILQKIITTTTLDLVEPETEDK